MTTKNILERNQFSVSDEELQSLISRYTRDITDLDRQGRFDPISGRDAELDHMTLILLQRLRKNVMLLGNAGVGKTALFIGLAQLINQDKVPDLLKGATIIELEMSMIGAGSQSRADLEGRLIPIVKGVSERNALRDRPPIIFCIDEIHQLMISFKASSYSGIADLLKPYLTEGLIYVIGATTREEYQDYVTVEPAIDRRFQRIVLDMPDPETTYHILLNMKANFEQHYRIAISDEACAYIVKLAERYIRNRTNPDKSILSLDQACARYVKKGLSDALDRASIEEAIAGETGLDASAVR
ncbi:MAG: AAA family ATPase [Alphaproteobacteria bacterium]|nr:AAA family ATPase [Alphaproteobacteria bacterium]MCL2504906.1 AAA family ATPase [Alphaproteobacteria bacterium]